MKLKSTLLLFLFLSVWNTIFAQINQSWCIQDAVISVSGGSSELFFCEGDGIGDKARFKVTPFAQPFAYLVTDENDVILLVSRNNTIDFEGLGGGKLRVYAFAYLGHILAEPGQIATEAVLADICYGLTQNFIPVGSLVPDAGSIATSDGRSSLFTCPDDGNSDIISFTNTSTDPFYSYVITDENNIILAFAEDDSFDFENLSAENVRVWGVSYIGNILAQVGDDLSTVDFASGCFDLSDNFIEVKRSFPNGGSVSLATGETSKTICAEDLEGDILNFTSNTDTENPYAFVVTDENGIVIAVLNGNTANFTLTDPGICRVYGVSYTGELKVAEGDDINTAVLSDDCFDVSDNFVEIIKREVDGGMVSLAGGGTSALVCVEGGESNELSFENTSMATDANYAYIITDQSNVIQAVVTGSSFNFANINSRNNRVWGLSYTGTLLANVGDNAANAALASECYDLSDNFVLVTRKGVDGGVVNLESGAVSLNVCVGDGLPDILSFVNSSTSVESYIYLVTNAEGEVIGFINGNQFDFETLTVDVFVYGLSYSGLLEIGIGDNINDGNFSTECADLSENFVTIFRKFVEGGTVSVVNGPTELGICSGDGEPDVVNFATNSSARENYIFIVTNTNNEIISFVNGNSFDFAGNTNATFRVWGLSYSGNVLASPGDDLESPDLADECFELSDNFVTVNRSVVDGATVSLIDGGTEAVLCLGTGQSAQFVFANTSEFGNYAYLLTTEDNIVIETTLADAFDLSGFPAGTYRVWGVSYLGNFLVQPGDDAANTPLADDCFELSDNFVTISTDEAEGGMISLVDGGDAATVCIGDFNADVLEFATTSTTANYAFLITDTNNIILAITTDENFDFSTVDATNIRVWGLGYSGNLTAQTGNDAANTELSDACFDLSDNFLSITRNVVDGATVSLDNGDTLAVTCVGVPEIEPVNFINTSTAANFAYLVTDELNEVLAIVEGSSFSFEGFSQGNYRVWGVSYTGNLTVQVGDDASATPLSDECFDLSDNFISIVQKDVDGGTVSLLNGETTLDVCGSSSTPGATTFDKETTSNASYMFVITNEDDEIFTLLVGGNSVNLNNIRIGSYRVWGVSYTGNVTARTGENLFEIALSDECFDISDNFVSIRKEETTGGVIAEASGETAFTFCPGNGIADVLQFSTTGNSSGEYAFVLTDGNNNFILALAGESIDFDTLAEGTYRVWGLAYTGNLTVQSGDNAAQVDLSDQCFDLSDNFIEVVNQTPDGGMVSLFEGATAQFTCPADGIADEITFFNEGNIGAGFVFLVTDENNIIEAIVEGDSYDFEQDTEGVNRVWGLAYSGNLTAQVGDDAATAVLSDDCYDLSDNFIEITREIPNGGIVSLQNGDTTGFVCIGSDPSTILKFDSTGTSRGEYIYVITDLNNIIRNGILGDEFDFSFLQQGTYRVWGLAYTGNLIATIGDIVTEVAISDDCFELSENFTTIVVAETDGGTVATAAGATSVTLCIGDGEASVVKFDSITAAASGYVYLITDKNNVLITVADGDSYDFEGSELDTCHVWGLSYNGEILVQPGEIVTMAALSEGCFDLSDNFILIDKSQVDGATIASNRGSDVVYICTGDSVADTVIFSNTSTSGAQYIYVLTNENNVIRGTITGDRFDFETIGAGVSRIWGVSYTGTFTGAFGANITTTVLSTGCAELSDNFITISRDTPLGGNVSTESGAVSTIVCPSPSNPGINFQTTSMRRVGYLFVVTDTNNTVITFSDGTFVDFAALPVGNYRVWGFSFTGDLRLNIGDNILGTDPLATSCFEISANFVEIYRSTLVDGGQITNTNGPDTLYVCPNEDSDLVVLSNDSEATDANYRYVLTNGNNVILSRNLDQVIDFNGAMRGVYRIYGISYTGTFVGLASDNVTSAVLSDSCYQISENFITIIVDTPDGGTVATTDSLTIIEPRLDLGEPELFSFMSANTSIVKYQYLVTNVNDEIVAFIDSIDVNFEDLAVWGTLKVWGLAYTGEIIAQVGDDLDDGPLTDDCFDLSENFVTAAFPVPGVENERTERAQPVNEAPATVTTDAPISIAVSPNPATVRLNVNVSIENPQSEQSTLRIYNLTGRLMYEQEIDAKENNVQQQIRISDLPDGMYLLQLRNGKQVQTVRFLKQWQ